MRKYASTFWPFILTALFAGTVLAILAPFGTQAQAPLLRFLYWVGFILIGGIGVWATDQIIHARNAKSGRFVKALWRSIGASVSVLIATIVLSWVTGRTMTLPNIFLYLFYIWVVAFTICFVATYTDKPAVSKNENDTASIFQRLKPALRDSEIYALSAEDHYVRILTSKGEDLVLMRLSDAIKEAAPLPGLSPHRSWWVAEAGVQMIKKNAGKTLIVLKNNMQVPVSRSAKPKLREAGWR